MLNYVLYIAIYVFHNYISKTHINPSSPFRFILAVAYLLGQTCLIHYIYDRHPFLFFNMTGVFRITQVTLSRFRRLTRGVARKSPSLHPKHGPKNYYKGYGAKSMGSRTRRGGYVMDYEKKVPQYIVPDLEGCELKPYVSAKTPLIKVPPPPMPDLSTSQ